MEFCRQERDRLLWKQVTWVYALEENGRSAEMNGVKREKGRGCICDVLDVALSRAHTVVTHNLTTVR